MREYVESFPDKDFVELMAIDPYGKVSITSSGFSYQKKDQMPDYNEALSSADGTGYYVGRLSNGQKIMAVTQMVSVVNSEISAMRFVVSLENVDAVIFQLIVGISVVAVAVLALVLISEQLLGRSREGILTAASKRYPTMRSASSVRPSTSWRMNWKTAKK